jgi:enterochelin esterase family protein
MPPKQYLALAVCLAVALPAATQAQDADGQPKTCLPQGGFAPVAAYETVEVLPDNRVTFRLCAPNATEVRVTSADVADAIPTGFEPGTPNGLAMTKDATGLWSVTTERPVAPDTYRYSFRVHGVKVPNPQGTTYSEERAGTNSTFEVLGPEGEFQTWKADVPHGVVSEIEYWSGTLGMKRRAHVYTPPSYMKGAGEYPVLYLVHGAGDSDDSWTSVGHANAILDNLIAAGKATPMIVVMPFGHTPERQGANMLANTDFGGDLVSDLIPHIDAQFRTIAAPEARAMAGLSMGGAHTVQFGLTNPALFSHVGIFSMGLGVGGNMDQVRQYEAANDAALKRAAEDMKLVYYAMGSDDFLYDTVAPTRALFGKYGIDHVYNESEGGHTWINWRRYLADFAPRLFK